MQELALRDALTGVGNRRWFDEEASALLLAERTYPCVLLLVDTDHFKEVNDTFGHPSGDEVLRAIASILQEVTARVKRGCCARIGGDEFGTLWPATTEEHALILAESVRARLADKQFAGSRRVTVSIGLAVSWKAISLVDLIRDADTALYRAKAAGRNEIRALQAQDRLMSPSS
jgi:two-component system cell cycle response regulator